MDSWMDRQAKFDGLIRNDDDRNEMDAEIERIGLVRWMDREEDNGNF